MSAKKVRVKHIPQRTCIVCREKRDKRQLIRLVRTPDEGVVVDPTGKRNGRGAYLCDKSSCWSQALDSQALDRALKVGLSDEERQAIWQKIPLLVDN